MTGDVTRVRRSRRAIGKVQYEYNRSLLMPLIERFYCDEFFSGLETPVLRMTAEDRLIATNHIVDGAWSAGLPEEMLPQFQQDARHLRFCDDMFDE